LFPYSFTSLLVCIFRARHSSPTRRSSDLRHSRSAASTGASSGSRPPPGKAHSPGWWRIRRDRSTSRKARSPSPDGAASTSTALRSEEHTSELQSRFDLVCRLLLEQKKHNI